MNLNQDDKTQLLSIARRAIESQLGQSTLSFSDNERENPNLQHRTGVFVTLTSNGDLRGCIGTLDSQYPLVDEVVRQARNAAFHDPRFDALSGTELNDIAISISVLTPSEKIQSSTDIVIGEHGIILQKGGRSSVFLPKVPIEQGWSLDDTLTHLSLKAGLDADGWKSNCEFLVFKSIDFEE